MITDTLKEEALSLKAIDRIRLAELILGSLDKPDPEIESKWIKESEERYDAYKQNKLTGTSIEDVKKRYDS